MKEIHPINLKKDDYYYILCKQIDNCTHNASNFLCRRTKLLGKISSITKFSVGSINNFRVIFTDVYVMPKREKTYNRYFYLDGETTINNSEIIYECTENPIILEKKLYSYALNKILSDITGDKYFYTDIL